jgi:hypothetical protein
MTRGHDNWQWSDTMNIEGPGQKLWALLLPRPSGERVGVRGLQGWGTTLTLALSLVRERG